MHSSIVGFFLTTFLFFAAQALDCNNNPCQLGGHYVSQNGYQCLQFGTEAVCTCPNGGSETDRPCRVCNRVDPANNPCRPNSALIQCLETDDFGTSFACLCEGPSGPFLTATPNCDISVTLTSTAITTTVTVTITLPPNTPPICSNGGNFVDSTCICPSGFDGIICERKNDSQLCEGIVCQNRGVCAIRNPKGPYEAVCLCRYGTWGEYCQLTGTLGFCTSSSCLNGAACQENVVGATRHAYCDCPPGYSGIKCETRYFLCTGIGKFADSFMQEQGKYFECTQVNGVYRAERKSCSKGLRFNASKNTCTK